MLKKVQFFLLIFLTFFQTYCPNVSVCYSPTGVAIECEQNKIQKTYFFAYDKSNNFVTSSNNNSFDDLLISRMDNDKLKLSAVNNSNNKFEIILDKKDGASINQLNIIDPLSFRINQNIYLYNNLISKKYFNLDTSAGNINNYSRLKADGQTSLSSLNGSTTNHNFIDSDGSLKIQANTDIINRGTILCSDTFTIASKLGWLKTFHGRIFVKGQWFINLPNGNLFSESSSNVAVKDIHLKTRDVIFRRVAPKEIESKQKIILESNWVSEIFNGPKYKTLINKTFQEKGEGNFFGSIEGTVNVSANTLTNQGSIIFGKKILFNGKKVNNLCPERVKIEYQLLNEDFNGDGVVVSGVKKIEKNQYVDTSIVADEIIFNIDGKTTKINKNIPYKNQIEGVNNTGFIGANEDFIANGDSHKKAQFYNGKNDGKKIEAPNYDSKVSIALVPNFNLNKNNYLILNQNSEFIYNHPYENEDSSSLIQYFVHLKESKKNKLKILTSPDILAETLQSEISKNIGKPILSEYKNFKDQLHGLIKNGFCYALIHGNLEKISDCSKEEIVVDEELRNDIQDIIKKFNGKISPEEYLQRQSLVKNGSHKLVLTQDLIAKSQIPFIYLKNMEINGIKSDVAHLHLVGKPINGSKIQANNISILSFDKVYNYGSIQAFKHLKINSRITVNARKVGKEIKQVFNKVYEVRVPLNDSGDMIGCDIEITSEDPKGLISNVGGNIFGQQSIKLYNKFGNIENKSASVTKVVSWNPGNLDYLFGKENSALALDYVGGKISCAGDIDIVSDLAKVINEASFIVSQNGSVNLKAYLGILIKSLVSVHTQEETVNLAKNGIVGCKKQAANIGLAGISAKKNINIETEKYLEALAAILNCDYLKIKSKYNNNLGPIKAELIQKASNLICSPNEFKTECSKLKTADIFRTVVNANKLDIESEFGDSISEAVIYNAGQYIHITAGKGSIIFKGAQQNNNKNSTGLKLGVSYLPLDAISKLTKADESFIWNLASNDPLLNEIQAIQNIKNAPDGIAQGTKTGVEVLRLIKQYSDQLKSNQSYSRFLTKRLGLTDANGNFKPQLQFGLSADNSSSSLNSNVSTEINTPMLICEANDTVKFQDNVQTNIKKLEVVSNDFEVSGSKTVQNNKTIGLGATTTGQINGNIGHSSQTENSLCKFDVDDAIIKSKNVKLDDARLKAKNLDLEAKKVSLISRQDKAESFAASAFAGKEGGGGSLHTSSSAIVKEQTGIQTTETAKLNIEQLDLDGSYLNHIGKKENANYNIQKINHQNIYDHDKSKKIGVAASVNPGDIVSVIADGVYASKDIEVTNRSTITTNANLNTKSDISSLNRKVNRSTQITKDESTYFRLLVPLVDATQLHEALDDISKFVSGEKKASVQNMDKVLKALGVDDSIESKESSVEFGPVNSKDIESQLNVKKDSQVEQTTDQNENKTNETPETNLNEPEDLTEIVETKKLELSDGNQIIVNTINVQSQTLQQGSQQQLDKKLKLIDYSVDAATNIANIVCANDNAFFSIKCDKSALNSVINLQRAFIESYFRNSPGCLNNVIPQAHNEPALYLQAASIILDFTVVGPYKSFAECVTGKDYITGEQLSIFSRVCSGIGAIPIVHKIKLGAKLIQAGAKSIKSACAGTKVAGQIRKAKLAFDLATSIPKKTQEVNKINKVLNIGTKAEKVAEVAKSEFRIVSESAKYVDNRFNNVWDMVRGGKVINGRFYTEHALERMAPNIPEVVKELEKRALERGLIRGSAEFKKALVSRNIPPSVIEETIKVAKETGMVEFQKSNRTFKHTANNVVVSLNESGAVVTAY